MDDRAAALRNEAASPSLDPRNGPWSPAVNAPPNATNAFDSGSGAMMIEGRPAASRRGLVWVGVAALVGASLGIGVLSYVRTARRARAAVAVADATPPSSAVLATGAVMKTPVPTVTSPAPPGSILITGAGQGRVHLQITPSTAVLVVDGIVLPPGTDTIVKPVDGATMNVLVRADKHEDTIVLVDSATPDEVEVTLLPNTRPAGPPSVTGLAGGAGGAANAPNGQGQGQGGTQPATGPSAGGTASVTKPRQPGTGAGAGGRDAGAPVIDAPPNPYD